MQIDLESGTMMISIGALDGEAEATRCATIMSTSDPFWSAHPITRYPVLRAYLSGYRVEGVINGDTIYRRL